jgi:DNA-directed RNA polymerase specialized sigma24 family protein
MERPVILRGAIVPVRAARCIDSAVGAAVAPATMNGSSSAIYDGLKASDPRVFGLLMEQYGGALAAMAQRFGWRESDRTEFVHDVLKKAFGKGRRLRSPEGLTSWLLRLALNLAKDRMRSASRFLPLPEPGGDDAWPRSGTPTPEDAVIVRVLMERVRGELTRANPEWVRALEDHLDGLSREQSAKQNGKRPRMIKRYLERLRALLTKVRNQENE